MWKDLGEYAALKGRHIHHASDIVQIRPASDTASVVETLDTCTHLVPDSYDRTRQAVDVLMTSDQGVGGSTTAV